MRKFPQYPSLPIPNPVCQKNLIIFDGKNVLQRYLFSTYDVMCFKQHLTFGDDPLFPDGKDFGDVSRQNAIW